MTTATDALPNDLDLLCINTIRTLSIDAVQKANSGHPGTPMGLAPVAYQLWQQRLNYDPADPVWPNRDRFVLSCGHASMLLYSLLHLTNVRAFDRSDQPLGKPAVSLDDIKGFRQLDSVCPGHPEYGLTTGVEATTGPLGQGVAMSVGMAMAERWLATTFNRPDFDLMDYRTYVLASDGDMMEGISGEAASLAAHLKLSKLCWIYDSNQITIEGPTSLAFSEDVAARFLAYGWNVLHVRDANSAAEMHAALEKASYEHSRPTLIVVESHIGYGSPNKQDSASAHGEPLGEDEVRLAKKFYGWPEDAKFLVPDGVYQHFAEGIGARGASHNAAWKELFERYRAAHPDLAAQFDMLQKHELPAGWEQALPEFPADAKGLATRDSSGKVENAVAQQVPWLVGGAGDLAPSTKTLMKFEGAGSFEASNYGGRNMHFGIREHAMGAIVNGLVLSKLRAFGSGFLIFYDYMRNPVRLSAIMEIPALYIFTHDSIGVGEDGPTHQPVEQIVGLRAIPGMITIRPADANEVSDAWRTIMKLRHHPASLILSRQPLPTLDRTRFAKPDVARGAYILIDPPEGKTPQVILIGTGSEVSLCVEAAEDLVKDGVAVRVVSMPSWELYEQQDIEYREKILPRNINARVGVEQASTIGWERYVGRDGAMVGMHSFGASAPMKGLLEKFGFMRENLVKLAKEQIARHSR